MPWEPPRRPDVPTPGHYAVRLVRGGPDVAARIIEQDGLWLVLLNGQPTSKTAMPGCWEPPWMERVAFGKAISEAAYAALLDATEGAQPGDPLADPNAPVDLANAPPVF